MAEAGKLPLSPVARPVVERYYLLDILRGLASLGVVLWHYQHFFFVAPEQVSPDYVRADMPAYALLGPFYSFGWAAVYLFFSLSGFIFIKLYLVPLASNRINARTFFILRFSRLYPLHLATLVLVAAGQFVAKTYSGSYVVYACNDGYHFVLNLFFMQYWGLQQCASFNGVSWSISIEILLYASFLLVALATPARLNARFLTMFVVAGLGAFVMQLAPFLVGAQIGGAFYAFFAGGLGALWLGDALDRGVAPLRIVLLSVVIVVAGVAGMVLKGGSNLLLFGFVFPGLILCLAAVQHIGRDLGRKMIVLGDITYGTYLVHFPIQLMLILAAQAALIHVDYKTGGALLMFLGLVVAVSVPVYYCFERPMQSYLRRLLLTPTPTSAAIPAGAEAK